MSSNGMPRQPRPPTASTPLWAHFMQPKSRAPTTLANIPSAVPPSAPLDKNAISMRVLLHDTQANLEKFGGHVQNLVEGVKEAKTEIKIANTLFERDREGFMGDIADLINRTQREIQKAVGSPAQDERIYSLFHDFTGKIGRLDQRLDALQTFNQTHSQALQTQMQAVQILMDKQASIISAVLPLLPLVQALPLYIDAAKTSICENATKALSDHVSDLSKSLAGSISSTFDVLTATGTTKRKRADSPSEQSSPTMTYGLAVSRKRSRKELTDTSPHISSPLGNVGTRAPESLQQLKPPTPRTKTACEVSKDGPLERIMSTAMRRNTSSASGQFATPRRPLSELLPSLLPQASVATPRARKISGSVQPGVTPLQPNTHWPATTPSTLREIGFQDPKLTPAGVQSSLAMSLRSHSRRPSVTDGSTHLSSPIHALNTGARPTEKAGSPSRSTVPTVTAFVQRMPEVLGSHSRPHNITSAPDSSGPDSARKEVNDLKQCALFGNDRRSSPLRDKRRFIPLVDSDDEEEEEE